LQKSIDIDELIKEHLDEILAIRRDIHEHPELGMQEFRTSELVAKELKKLGLEVQTGIGKLGVVGLLRGNEDGKTVLLRADMDALPLDELTDLPFKSKTPGVMHACGHDVHTSTLLGAAKVLTELKDDIKGNIKFVFQPAEEMNPTGGARYMIEDGVLENPKVDAALALHVWDLPVGTIGLKPGPMMAQSDRIFITVKGTASHGSQPQSGVDAVVVASHIVTALQTIISRNVDPMESAVISIGTIHGGNRYNVIADTVKMEGTVRIFDTALAELLPNRIKSIVENICTAFGAQCEFEYVRGYSLTVNDEELTKKIASSFIDTFGKENIKIADKPASGGEDFSEFTKKVPSVYFWLGIVSDMNKDKCTIHNPNLTVDEDAIPIGIKALVTASLDYLNS
jgi:amidohydrolase